jgi:putative redox protein
MEIIMDQILKWNSGMSFTADIRGHKTPIDAGFAVGGTNTAPTPKELVLTGVAGCSGMDAIVYLKKFHLTPLDLIIKTEAELTEKAPSYFKKIHVTYKFLGDGLPVDKVIKAVETSMTKYCGVSFILSKTCPITYDILLNGEKIFSGEAKFNL